MRYAGRSIQFLVTPLLVLLLVSNCLSQVFYESIPMQQEIYPQYSLPQPVYPEYSFPQAPGWPPSVNQTYPPFQPTAPFESSPQIIGSTSPYTEGPNLETYQLAIEEAWKEIETLKNEIDAKRDQGEMLANKNAKLNERVVQLAAELEERLEANKQLVQTAGILNDEKKSLRASSEKQLEELNTKLGQQLRKLEQTRDGLSGQLEDRKLEIAELKKRNKSFTSDKAKLSGALKLATKETAQLKQDFAAIQKKRDLLKKAKDESTALATKFKEKNAQLEKDRDKSVDALAVNKARFADEKKSQLKSNKKKLDELDQIVARQKKEQAETLQKLQDRKREIAELTKQNKSLAADESKLASELKLAVKQKDKLELDFATIQKKRDLLEKENSKNTELAKMLKEKNAQLVVDRDQSIDTLMEKKARFEGEINSLLKTNKKKLNELGEVLAQQKKERAETLEKLQDRKREIAELKKQNKSFAADEEKLSKELATVKKEAGKLQRSVAELQKKNGHLQESNKENVENAEQLKKANAQLKTAKTNSDSKIADSENRYKSLLAERSELRDSIKTVSKNEAQLIQKLAQAAGKTDSIKQLLGVATKKLEDSDLMSAEFEKKQSALREEIESLTVARERLAKQNKGFKNRESELVAEIQSAKEQQKDLKSFKKKFDAAEEQIQELKLVNARLDKSIGEFESQRSAMSENSGKANEQIQLLKSQLSSSQTENKEMRTARSEREKVHAARMEVLNRRLNDDTRAMRTEIEKLTNRFAETTKENAALEAEMKEFEEKAATANVWEKEKRELDSNLSDTQNQLSEWKQKYQELSDESASKLTESQSKFAAEKEQLDKDMGELQLKMDAANEEAKKSKAGLAELEKKLQEMKANSTETEKSNDGLLQTLESMTEKQQSSKLEFDALRNEVEDAKSNAIMASKRSTAVEENLQNEIAKLLRNNQKLLEERSESEDRVTGLENRIEKGLEEKGKMEGQLNSLRSELLQWKTKAESENLNNLKTEDSATDPGETVEANSAAKPSIKIQPGKGKNESTDENSKTGREDGLVSPLSNTLVENSWNSGSEEMYGNAMESASDSTASPVESTDQSQFGTSGLMADNSSPQPAKGGNAIFYLLMGTILLAVFLTLFVR